MSRWKLEKRLTYKKAHRSFEFSAFSDKSSKFVIDLRAEKASGVRVKEFSKVSFFRACEFCRAGSKRSSKVQNVASVRVSLDLNIRSV